MPFKSKAQQAYMFANMPAMAKRWAAETPNIKALPAHAVKAGLDKVAKKKRKKS